MSILSNAVELLDLIEKRGRDKKYACLKKTLRRRQGAGIVKFQLQSM